MSPYVFKRSPLRLDWHSLQNLESKSIVPITHLGSQRLFLWLSVDCALGEGNCRQKFIGKFGLGVRRHEPLSGFGNGRAFIKAIREARLNKAQQCSMSAYGLLTLDR